MYPVSRVSGTLNPQPDSRPAVAALAPPPGLCTLPWQVCKVNTQEGGRRFQNARQGSRLGRSRPTFYKLDGQAFYRAEAPSAAAAPGMFLLAGPRRNAGHYQSQHCLDGLRHCPEMPEHRPALLVSLGLWRQAPIPRRSGSQARAC